MVFLFLCLSLFLSSTCTNPSADLFPSWDFNDLLTWPICRDSPELNPNRSDHRTCELVGRPCCHGIQGNCNITTREYCDFLQGRFHQDAFLCSQVWNYNNNFRLLNWKKIAKVFQLIFVSAKCMMEKLIIDQPSCIIFLYVIFQVDCLGSSCGLLPFGRVNVPDQVYRLWLALFLHAGWVTDQNNIASSAIYAIYLQSHTQADSFGAVSIVLFLHPASCWEASWLAPDILCLHAQWHRREPRQRVLCTLQSQCKQHTCTCDL